jgi:hypothetical protein
MGVPAPFLVDPADPTQLLIGTCRVWRGPAGGTGWSGAKASLILDQLASPGPCSGNALIRSLAAMEIAGGGEVVYAGMYGDWGDLGLGGNAPGQVFSVTYNPASGWSNPQNLTLNPVTLPSQSGALNALNLDISSITIDPHDLTGQTVYVTVEGFSNPEDAVPTIYRSTNGGASWVNLTANLPWAPANSVAVDPQSANTVYVATDVGVYFTTGVGSCTNPSPNCWSLFGAGLPKAPVVQLSAAPLTASAPVLTAGTYGRGIWQTPLWSSETGVTTAITSPPSPVIFTTPVAEYSSSALTVSVENRAFGGYRHQRRQQRGVQRNHRRLPGHDRAAGRQLHDAGDLCAHRNRHPNGADDHLRQRLRRSTAPDRVERDRKPAGSGDADSGHHQL